jgi:hypothetical protein
MQSWFDTRKSMIGTIVLINDKNHIITSIDIEKVFGGEINQALYAHMNNKRKMKKKKRKSI